MAITYDLTSGNATTVLLSRVRFYLQDLPDHGQKPEGENVTDAEILDALAVNGNVPLLAAADCALALSNAWATYATWQAGGRSGRSESLSDVAEQWAKRAKDWQVNYNRGAPIHMGGISQADIDANNLDEDQPSRAFTRTLFSHRRPQQRPP